MISVPIVVQSLSLHRCTCMYYTVTNIETSRRRPRPLLAHCRPVRRIASHKPCTSGSSLFKLVLSSTARASWTCEAVVDPHSGVMSHLSISMIRALNDAPGGIRRLTIGRACTASVPASCYVSPRGQRGLGVVANSANPSTSRKICTTR